MAFSWSVNTQTALQCIEARETEEFLLIDLLRKDIFLRFLFRAGEPEPVNVNQTTRSIRSVSQLQRSILKL